MLIQKTIHQSNLAGNVEQAENTITLFILEETKEYCEWLEYCKEYYFISQNSIVNGFLELSTASIINLFWLHIFS